MELLKGIIKKRNITASQNDYQFYGLTGARWVDTYINTGKPGAEWKAYPVSSYTLNCQLSVRKSVSPWVCESVIPSHNQTGFTPSSIYSVTTHHP